MTLGSPQGEAQGSAEYKFVWNKFEQRPKRAGPEGVEGRTKSDGIGFERTKCGPKGEIQEVFRNPGINQVNCRRKPAR